MASLPPYATLATLSGPRTRRQEYVRRVLANLPEAKGGGLGRRTLAVRIGITGNGFAPNYRIESPELASHNVASAGMMLARDVYKFYRGMNHEEMTELDDLLRRDEHWSTAVTGFDQVELLLGELRKIR